MFESATSAEIREGDFAEAVKALQAPAAYAHPVDKITAIETHFAWVFLAGEYAYKLKKPLGTPAVDLRKLDTRRSSCDQELQLNRRLAPDVYLSVAPLVRTADRSLRVDGEGRVVDWLIRMRRLPTHLMLDRAIVARTVSTSALRALGVRLAQFYRAQPRVTFEPQQYTARIAEQINADRRALSDPELGLVERRVQAALTAGCCAFSSLENELAQRAAEDRIVVAHGDLRPEHICLEDPPCVIDALDFSEDLRTLDPAEELAFLWVECEQAGDVRPARQVLEFYRRESGDPVSDRLLAFYRSRRALVRAKIVAWHLYDPVVTHLAPWRERADAYIALSERYARCVCASGPASA